MQRQIERLKLDPWQNTKQVASSDPVQFQLKWQTSTICRFYYTFHPTTMLWNSNSESSSTFFSQKDQISHQSSNKKANKNMRLIQIFEPHDAITTLPSRYRSLIASCRRTSAAHEVGRRRTRGRGVRWAGPVRDQDLGGWSLVSLDLGWMKHGKWSNLRKGCWKYHCLLWVCCESHLNLSSIIQTIMKLDSDLKENVLWIPMARSSMYPMPCFLSNKLATNGDMTWLHIVHLLKP